METRRRISPIAAILLASGLALPAAADDKESGGYFEIGPGVNFAESVKVDVGGAQGRAQFDTGFRVGATLGYQFNKWFSMGFETGYIYNGFQHSDSSLSHVPFLADFVLQLPIRGWVTPYFGAGIGGAANILALDHFDRNFNRDEGDSDWNLAWQAATGVRVRVADGMSVEVGYKYFGTSDSTYHFDNVDVKLGASQNHAVNAAFRMVF